MHFNDANLLNFLNFLNNELLIFKKFKELLQEELNCIEAEDMQALTAVISAKDVLIEAHGALSAQYGGDKSRFDEAGKPDEIKELIADIKENLKLIQDLQEKTYSALAQKTDDLRTKLKQLNHGRQILKGYANAQRY